MLAEVQDFVNWVRRRNPQARTWRDYSYDLSLFVAIVGDLPPNKVTFREVDLFLTEQVNQGLCPSTINRRIAALLCFYSYLAGEDSELVCPVFPRRHRVRQRELLPRPGTGRCPARFLSRPGRRCAAQRVCGQPGSRPGHVPAHALLRAAYRRSGRAETDGPLPG